MTARKSWLLLGLAALIVPAVVYGFNRRVTMQNASELGVTIQIEKKSYLPGEVISLQFDIKNQSAGPVSLVTPPTVWDGNLRVFIALEEGPFKEYIGPRWGTRDQVHKEPPKLMPGESFITEATILWNQTVESSHLSELYAKKISKSRLPSNYAFQEAGTYHIKAVLLSPATGTSVESNKLQVVIEEPLASNLDVWKTLKCNSDYALFIQTGGLFEPPDGSATIRIARQLEQLILKHPETRYAGHIRQSLSKRKDAI